VIDASESPTTQEYLDATGHRGTVHFEEFKAWALERCGESRVRVRSGERFELVEEALVRYTIFWKKPVQSGGTGALPSGTVVTACFDTKPDDFEFLALPEPYLVLEQALVPAADRTRRAYGGYALKFLISHVGPVLQPVEVGQSEGPRPIVFAQSAAPWLRGLARFDPNQSVRRWRRAKRGLAGRHGSS